MRKVTKAELEGSEIKVLTFTRAQLGDFSKPSYETSHSNFSHTFEENLTFVFDSINVKIPPAGLERDFLQTPVTAMSAEDLGAYNEEIAIFFDKWDEEGWIMEKGDIMLLSAITKRDKGRDEYQFAIVSAEDFRNFFLRVGCRSFRPGPESSYGTMLDDNQLLVSQNAMLQEQLDGIKGYSKDSYSAHYRHIENMFSVMAEKLTQELLKQDILQGKGYVLETLTERVTGRLGAAAKELLHLETQPYKAMKAIMKDTDFVQAFEAKGSEYVETTLAQWVEDAKAIFPEDARPYNRLTVASIFAEATKTKERPTDVFGFHTGGSSLLRAALARAFMPGIDAHIEQVTTGLIEWTKNRNIAAAKAQVRGVLAGPRPE